MGSRSPTTRRSAGTTAAQSPPKVLPSRRQRRPPRHASHPWTDVVGARCGARRYVPSSRLDGCDGHHCSGGRGGRDTAPPRPSQSHHCCRATAHPEADTRPRPATPTGRGSPGGCGHDDAGRAVRGVRCADRNHRRASPFARIRAPMRQRPDREGRPSPPSRPHHPPLALSGPHEPRTDGRRRRRGSCAGGPHPAKACRGVGTHPTH